MLGFKFFRVFFFLVHWDLGGFVNYSLSLQFFTLIVVECSCAAKYYYNGISQFCVLLVSNLKSLDVRVRDLLCEWFGLVFYFISLASFKFFISF